MHFILSTSFKSRKSLGNRDRADKHSNPYLQAWLHLHLFHDCWALGFRTTPAQRVDTAYNFSLPQLWCSHKTGRLTFVSGSLLWGICAPYTTDLPSQVTKASSQDFPFHISRDAGLQKLPRQFRLLCWAGWETITLLEKPSKILVGQCLDETPEQKTRGHPKGCPWRAKWQQVCITHILNFSYFNVWNRCQCYLFLLTQN